MSLKTTGGIEIVMKSPHVAGFDPLVVDGGDVEDEIERYNLLVERRIFSQGGPKAVRRVWTA